MSESSVETRAPAALELVQSFVNTVEIFEDRREEEELTDPEALRAWLTEHDLMDASEPVTDADLTRAIDVREGLRSLLLAHNGEEVDAAKVARLDRAAGRASFRASFAGGTPELVPGPDGVDGALARLLAIVAAPSEQGTWERLKACPRDCCLWAFYDKSKNRSRRWCSMESCGNVEKARAFRHRQRAAADA
jgi:predicted RNA-binding Zn ribbon-like protein